MHTAACDRISDNFKLKSNILYEKCLNSVVLVSK